MSQSLDKVSNLNTRETRGLRKNGVTQMCDRKQGDYVKMS